MSVLSKLTVKPLLWLAAAQFVVIAALCGLLALQQHWYDAKIETADARTETADAGANTARVERDAWKTRAAELDAANFAHQSVNATLRRLLGEAQRENTRLQDDGRAAVAAAEAAKDEADRTLAAWMGRYAEQVRAGDCAASLANVERACPAFGGY